MSRIYLVRHGAAAAGWDSDADPGLSEAGRAQAAQMSAQLAGVGPLPVITSPLTRCRETAAALERLWGVEASVDGRVGEIPSFGLGLAERGSWLRELFGRVWSDTEEEVQSWRAGVIEGLEAIAAATGGAVVVSHFVAINAVLGVAVGDDRVVVSPIDNCSVTEVDVGGDGITLVSVGRTATTKVL